MKEPDSVESDNRPDDPIGESERGTCYGGSHPILLLSVSLRLFCISVIQR